MITYCDVVDSFPDGERKDLHKKYHDEGYGFPICCDNELFGRLILEINQAGLSWETILKKQDNFRKAFSNFNIAKIANYSEIDRARLLGDSGIIRNRLKVDAVIYNAKVVITMQKEHGSFKNWLDSNYPLEKEQWIKLFKSKFKFVGGEIVNEFLASTGYLKGAHRETCPIYQKVLEAKPRWLESEANA